MIRLLLPLAVFAALAAVLYSGLGKDPTIIPSPLIGKPAPTFSLPSLHQEAVSVSSVELAGQPYVINVWASWCPGCRVEHALVEELARRNVAPLIGLNWKDQSADAKRWLEQFGDPYSAIAVDESGRIGIDFGVYGAPETFVVDAEGVIRFKHTGPITQDVLDDQIVPLVQSLRRS